jgi:hypothetical protein
MWSPAGRRGQKGQAPPPPGRAPGPVPPGGNGAARRGARTGPGRHPVKRRHPRALALALRPTTTTSTRRRYTTFSPRACLRARARARAHGRACGRGRARRRGGVSRPAGRRGPRVALPWLCAPGCGSRGGVPSAGAPCPVATGREGPLRNVKASGPRGCPALPRERLWGVGGGPAGPKPRARGSCKCKGTQGAWAGMPGVGSRGGCSSRGVRARVRSWRIRGARRRAARFGSVPGRGGPRAARARARVGRTRPCVRRAQIWWGCR